MQYNLKEIRSNIDDELSIKSSNAVILMCAIFIASIGLNLNSIPVVIGAMLISPLMNPILGLGLSLGISDMSLFYKALRLLGVQLGISILTSFLYFSFSPITQASDEIIARTFPTIWDVLIAFAGGTAGWIGLRKKVANNIVPGVAIATALMPPVCTIGYALSAQDLSYFLGAGYLFLINCSFILIATFIGVKVLLRSDKSLQLTKKKRINTYIAVLTFLVAVPSLFSAYVLIRQDLETLNMERFIDEEFKETVVLNYVYDDDRQLLIVTTLGNRFDETEREELNDSLSNYGFDELELTLIQIPDLNQLDKQGLEELFQNRTLWQW